MAVDVALNNRLKRTDPFSRVAAWSEVSAGWVGSNIVRTIPSTAGSIAMLLAVCYDRSAVTITAVATLAITIICARRLARKDYENHVPASSIQHSATGQAGADLDAAAIARCVAAYGLAVRILLLPQAEEWECSNIPTP